MGEETAALTELLERAHPGATVAVGEVQRLSAGASRRTLLVHATVDGAAVTDIVQVDQSGAGSAPRTGMAAQAELLRRAAAAGVPVPQVLAIDEGELLGGPAVVTAAVEGETIARRILRDDAYAPARSRFAADCGAALAGLHSIDPTGLALGPALDDPLRSLQATLDATGEPRPMFELALAWLAGNRPKVGEPVLVHGDFRLGNVIVDHHGLRAVLDWELAHLGDPMEDLGWLCAKAWRFGGPAPVGGMGERADLYAAYEAAGGRRVDADGARWWELRATLNWGIICMVQARRHLSGATPSMELATIGRRVCENEWDLALALWPDAVAALPEAEAVADGPGDDATGGLHGRPTAAELLDAVALWLDTDVAAAAPSLAFHIRVARNALGAASREARVGAAQAEAHRARLAALGVADDAALAAAIRSGELAGTDEVVAAVVAGVRDRLIVANPRYLRL